MGLDMYLDGEKYFWTDWENPQNNVKEDGYELKNKSLRLGYWRKHPNLHGYIVREFADGVDECQPIPLTAKDIDKIIQAIKDRALPHTTGFFFGQSDDSEEQAARDIKILEAAKAWLTVKEKGISRDVYYRASW